MKINVKSKREYEATIKELRAKGYMIITYAKRFAELENDNKIVIIEY